MGADIGGPLSAQVEAQVKDKDPRKSKASSGKAAPVTSNQGAIPQTIPEASEPMEMQNDTRYSMGEGTLNPIESNDPFTMPATRMDSDINPNMLNIPDIGLGLDDSFSWEMIGLGLEEPMPTQEAIDDL